MPRLPLSPPSPFAELCSWLPCWASGGLSVCALPSPNSPCSCSWLLFGLGQVPSLGTDSAFPGALAVFCWAEAGAVRESTTEMGWCGWFSSYNFSEEKTLSLLRPFGSKIGKTKQNKTKMSILPSGIWLNLSLLDTAKEICGISPSTTKHLMFGSIIKSY